MFHFKESIQNTKGDALIGYFVRLANTSDDSGITLYADVSLTPIVSVSGLADAAKVDSDGMADFWVPSGTYHMDIYATDGATLVRRETYMQMGVPSGDYGDVTVTDGDAWTVDAVSGTAPSSIGLAVLSAANQAAARTAIGAGVGGGDLVSTNNLSDVASASTSRTNLGLGTIATQSAASVAITGGSVTGITDLAVADGGTGASTASAARTGLGLAIGTDVQAYSTKLAAIAANTVTTDSGTARTAALADADTFIRFTSSSAVTFTIPPNSSVAFPVGTVIEFSQSGTGAVSAAAGAGVTINSRSSDLTLAGQYSVAFVKKVATDTWIMNGDL